MDTAFSTQGPIEAAQPAYRKFADCLSSSSPLTPITMLVQRPTVHSFANSVTAHNLVRPDRKNSHSGVGYRNSPAVGYSALRAAIRDRRIFATTDGALTTAAASTDRATIPHSKCTSTQGEGTGTTNCKSSQVEDIQKSNWNFEVIRRDEIRREKIQATYLWRADGFFQPVGGGRQCTSHAR